jgi:large subunit ribosomal protein L23
MREPHDVLIKPIITEKTSALMAEKKYTFKVDPQANKIEIKHAVRKSFRCQGRLCQYHACKR